MLTQPHEFAAKLGERTLTKFCNEPPPWFPALQAELAAAYGWPEDIATEDALEKLLALNLERSR